MELKMKGLKFLLFCSSLLNGSLSFPFAFYLKIFHTELGREKTVVAQFKATITATVLVSNVFKLLPQVTVQGLYIAI